MANKAAVSIVGLLLITVSVPAQEPPKLRLDGNARPREYWANLRVVPNEDTFSGTLDIDLDVRNPTKVIWLNASNLQVSEASLGGAAATVLPGGAAFLGFSFEKPVTSGRLHIRYSGVIDRKASAGIYQVKDGENSYVYTQFESISARRAFPCFDEPSYKVPWTVTLEVKRHQAAFSNTPVEPETSSADGMKTVRFQKTKPLPSYLVAFAVGPLEAVPARAAGLNKTPVRIIVPKGRKDEAAYATSVTPDIIEQLEKYFGIPFPYPKADSVAVPLMGGAMENPGLVTYGLPLILAKPAEDSIQRQRLYARIAAHELGHQWFGDLLTMDWWNDVWLNEAFATWVSNRVIVDWKPEWGDLEQAVSSRLDAMAQDSLINARRIRQPIESDNDIANAFDGITYQKGAAVIGMFERWVGPDRFRRGIKSYLDQYSYRNANADQFLAAISNAAGKNVAPQFSTFLDQAGAPMVSMALKCENGGTPALMLSQKRLLPQDSKGSADQVWKIPLCVAYETGGERKRECTQLDTPKSEWSLSTKSCPAWVMGNADAAGYYHVRYEGDLLNRVLEGSGRHLTPPELVSTLGDVVALVRTGDLSLAQALNLVPDFAGNPNRDVVNGCVSISDNFNYVVPSDLWPSYERFINAAFGAKALQLGWQAKPSEDADTRVLRPQLLDLVSRNGNIQKLNDEAQSLAALWIKDRTSVQPEMVDTVLSAAARRGNEALFNDFLAAAKASTDEKERGQLLTALGRFRNPELTKRALSLLLGSDFDPRESGPPLLFGPFDYPGTRSLPYEFVKGNYEALVTRWPSTGDFDLLAFLPLTAVPIYPSVGTTEVRAFFDERMKTRLGGPRNLARAVELIELRDAIVRAQQPAVREFLKSY